MLLPPSNISNTILSFVKSYWPWLVAAGTTLAAILKFGEQLLGVIMKIPEAKKIWASYKVDEEVRKAPLRPGPAVHEVARPVQFLSLPFVSDARHLHGEFDLKATIRYSRRNGILLVQDALWLKVASRTLSKSEQTGSARLILCVRLQGQGSGWVPISESADIENVHIEDIANPRNKIAIGLLGGSGPCIVRLTLRAGHSRKSYQYKVDFGSLSTERLGLVDRLLNRLGFRR